LRAPQLGADEVPVEPGVVGHKNPAREHGEDPLRQLGESGRVANHLIGDVGDGTDRSRYRPLRIHQRLEDNLPASSMHHRHRDLGDAVAETGAGARGFHVDHGKGAIIQQRRALGLGNHRPPAVFQQAHPRISSQQRESHAVADCSRCVEQTQDLMTQRGRGPRTAA
jgi:hypothetical protein